jgi:ribosomal protein L17
MPMVEHQLVDRTEITDIAHRRPIAAPIEDESAILHLLNQLAKEVGRDD